MQISLYKTDNTVKGVKRMAVGAYWVITASFCGYELVVCSAPVARDVRQVQHAMQQAL